MSADKIFTPAQKKAVESNLSCVVSAGAGSGKTAVLSERFLRLVKEGTDCNRILTITFSIKAASEMKQRIRALLVENNLTDQLALFSKARISTVDSFCHEIVRQDCRRYGISSSFGIEDQEDADKSYREIASRLLEENTDKPAGRYLLTYFSPSSITDMLCRVATLSNLVQPLVRPDSADVYLQTAQTGITNAESTMLNSIRAYLEFFPDEQEVREALRAFENGDGYAFTKTKLSKRGSGADMQEAVKKIKADFSTGREQFTLFTKTLENRENIEAVYSMFAEMEKRALNYRRSSGKVSFQDAMKMSIDILLKNKAIRQKYKNTFSYIMIDEFQDNNDDYRKLLYLLAEKDSLQLDTIPGPQDLKEGKIFLVGDEKQSIYRFRGADVSVFKRMQTEIALAGGELIELETNFRSTPALVDNFNSMFSRLMEDSREDYEAVFKPLESGRKQEVPSRTMLNIRLHPDKEDNTENMASYGASEAESIASLILEMTGTDNWLLPGGKRPSFSDIAVLQRTYTHQGDYEKAFRLNGIPYSLSQTKDLMQEALVSDFYSLLNLLVYPDDRICRKAVLNSPLRLALEEDNIEKLQNAVVQHGFRAALDFIWFDLGYRTFIITNPANQVYSEHYVWLYALASDCERRGGDLVSFLDELRTYIKAGDIGNKELNLFGDHTTGVKMMTIHRSKGLQFPIVIIAGMDSRTTGDKSNDITLVSDNLFLPLSIETDKSGKDKLVNLRTRVFGDTEKLRNDAELKRLFYVGATRAEQHLVFSCAPSISRTGSTLYELLLISTGAVQDDAELALSNVPSYLETRAFERIELEKTFSAGRLSQEKLNLNASWYENATTDSFDFENDTLPVTSLAAEAHEERHGIQLRGLKSDKIIQDKGLQADFGTYVHALIEAAVLNRPQPELTTDLNQEDRELFLKDAQSLAQSFLGSAFYNELKQKNCTLYPERRFLMYEPELGKMLRGSIDLLAENTEDGEITVIDFKTDIIKDPREHRVQVETYMKAARGAWPDMEIKGYLCYLRDSSCLVQI